VQKDDHANAGDYVCDLIQRDQERSERIAAVQRLVDEGLASGIGSRSKDELFAMAVQNGSPKSQCPRKARRLISILTFGGRQDAFAECCP
jgi:Arc/MetJ-type ribon-helix-helix transcriptional regulator